MQLPLPIDELALPRDGSVLPPLAARVYVNRSLRMDRIEWVGFDMDYTLAIYEQREMDRLSIEATAKKLVELKGYPEHLLGMEYRTDFPIRGLLVDKKLGNVLKMDRYRYVKKAYHGMHELDTETRRNLYHTRRLRPGMGRYHWVDTLYALAEVSVYAAAVEELEKHGVLDHEKLFADVRECIDLAHRDGSILDHIERDHARFVIRDPQLGPTLHKLRSAGKRLFLLTNSQPAYSDRMMRYLLDGALPEYPSWRNYFDVIVTASRKPIFFQQTEPFLEVLDDGTQRPTERLERGRLYMGGNIAALEEKLGVKGDQILYVGDHIYGDVLRAKKESAWRTAMIVQEMGDELDVFARAHGAFARADELDEARETLLHDLRSRQATLKEVQKAIDRLALPEGATTPPELEVPRARYRRSIDKLRARIRAVEAELLKLEEELDAAFHPFWGSLFKAGQEVSSFGDQVETYACIYTSRVSNLLFYSPMHYYRSPRHRMAHEL